MDNFRKRTKYNQRQAIDSILNTSNRSTDDQQRPQNGMSNGVRFEGLRSAGRRLDDFKRREGYHATQSGKVGVPNNAGVDKLAGKAEQAARNASLLHMTLPGGTLGSGKKQASKTKDHGKHSRWHTIRKWALRSTIALVVLVLLGGGFLFSKGLLKIQKVLKGGGSAAALESEVTPDLLKGEGEGRINILMLGKGGPGHEGADLTDTIIVASIDPVNKNATLVSVPRDLWVTVPGRGSTKINAVYANAKARSLNSTPKDTDKAQRAGVDALEGVISQVLGIPIHYYGMIDFTGFKQAVDIVGGIDMNVPEELAVSEHMWDNTTGKPYFLNVPAGQQHFDATRALYFTRSRHTSPRGDFDRSERQRLFIQALSQKVLSAGTYTNPIKISGLISAFGDHIGTDFNKDSAFRLMQLGKEMDITKTKSIGLADAPNSFVTTDNIDGQSIVRPKAGIGDYSEIQNYIRNTIKDPYLAKENATVAVLNGTTTAGLAKQKADELKTYGYNVTIVDSAPTQDYARTTLIDVTNNKPFTKNYLEKRLEVKATTNIPDPAIKTQGVDFVIILGQDE
jgi:LCP family protein required for cell wall assembly